MSGARHVTHTLHRRGEEEPIHFPRRNVVITATVSGKS